MNTSSDYYVYGYYDPRTLRLFYVGKGKGSRKNAHLALADETRKSGLIRAIVKAGEKPAIRVIAARLTEREALLVEKTLIWAHRHLLTNRNSGHFADRFRPEDSLHAELPGFDTNTGIYLVNVGQGPNRSWADCRKYGFLSAGGGRNWSKQLERLAPDDIVVAYLKSRGYVGIGKVLKPAVPLRDFLVRGKHLTPKMLAQPGLLAHASNAALSEYLVAVRWTHSVDAAKAHFARNGKLFTTQLVVASLAAQQTTLRYLESQFKLRFSTLTAD